jgi:hypothetical protein
MLIDLARLGQDLSNHVSTCTCAQFLCTEWASFESWFQVELVPVLMQQGYDRSECTSAYTYPGTRNKADLMIAAEEGQIVIEMKVFVSGQDANKKDRYPEQIARLLTLLEQDKSVAQVITFTTFQGYSPRQITNMTHRFFGDPRWSMVGPAPIVDTFPTLQYLITGAER